MSVHTSGYNFIFSLHKYILYSLDQTLKYLLKASTLGFQNKTVSDFRLCKEKQSM
jgi:hypothetical protein